MLPTRNINIQEGLRERFLDDRSLAGNRSLITEKDDDDDDNNN